MSSPVDQEPQRSERDLEDEFAALQRSERSFERRLQNGSIWMGVAAFGALILSAAAFAVALTNKPGTETVVMRSPSGGTPGTSAGSAAQRCRARA